MVVPMTPGEAEEGQTTRTTQSPTADGTVGYDLVIGDLVEPFGKGKSSDFIFHLTPRTNSSARAGVGWETDITFSHPDDGIRPFFVRHRNAQRSWLASSHRVELDLRN